MDAIHAIRERRMLPRVGEERPSREAIEELLELAVRAPTHHRTQPWRFHVFAGEGLERIAQALADAGETIEDARKKVSRAPVIIVVTCQPQLDHEGVVEQEELVSAAMAMENLLLAAYAKGFGAMLRTGPASYRPETNATLGLAADETIVGMVYLGHPAGDREATERDPASTKTRWIGWD